MEMNQTLIKEINKMKYIYCNGIQAQDGSLEITIYGTRLIPIHLEHVEAESKSFMKILDDNAKEIIPDENIQYKIKFDPYISYQVLNESYSCFNETEIFEAGNLFRIYTKSKYHQYLTDTTLVSYITDTYTHYGILCLDQIIDIISEEPPAISKYSK